MTATRARPITTRSARVSAPTGDGARVLTMTFVTGDKVEVVYYWCVSTGPGAWHLSKCEGGAETEKYDVTIGTFPTCQCKGWKAYGHIRPCRHISALTSLAKAGRI